VKTVVKKKSGESMTNHVNANDSRNPVRVAIAQAAPVYLDLEASLEKALELINRGARQDARLVVFAEAWLPDYPAWLDVCSGATLWGSSYTKDVFARLRANSVRVPGPEIDALRGVARDRGISIVIGLNERLDAGPGNGTLYNTLLTISEEGRVVNLHRKLVPTFNERLIWGQGNARGLQAVSTSAGRVGGLICWEHWMPLARMAMHDAGEQIHIAAWPTVNDVHQLASRHYAFEGRCFVLAAGLLMRIKDLPRELAPVSSKLVEQGEWVERGGSAVIGPDAAYVVEPVFDREELIMADLNFKQIDREVMTLDVSGHYSRPDLFHFEVRKL